MVDLCTALTSQTPKEVHMVIGLSISSPHCSPPSFRHTGLSEAAADGLEISADKP